MAKRTTEELAQQLADMKWGDSLSDLEIGANEARALGRAFVALRQQLEAVKPEQVDEWIAWGGDCEGTDQPVIGVVEVQFKDGSTDKGEANIWYWPHDGHDSDIIAYRVVS